MRVALSVSVFVSVYIYVYEMSYRAEAPAVGAQEDGRWCARGRRRDVHKVLYAYAYIYIYIYI